LRYSDRRPANEGPFSDTAPFKFRELDLEPTAKTSGGVV
jgi:hypothetical protein